MALLGPAARPASRPPSPANDAGRATGSALLTACGSPPPAADDGGRSHAVHGLLVVVIGVVVYSSVVATSP